MMSGNARPLGVAGPVRLHSLAHRLDTSPERLPAGLGGEPVTLLVDELVARGENVVLATLSRDVDRMQVFHGPGLEVHVGPYRRRGRARDIFRTERRAIAAAFTATPPRLINAHWTYEFAMGALASGHPTVVSSHDWAPTALTLHRHPYRAVRLGMQLYVLRRASHVTAVSPSLANEMSRVTRAPISVIPNGIDAGRFRSEPRHFDPNNALVVAVNQGFGRRKNVTSLLKAWPRIRSEVPHARLELIGEGHGRGEEAERWAATAGLADGVDFTGSASREEVDARLATASVLVHPSLWEACPMVLLEALVQGLPCVGGTTTPGVSWVLDRGAGVLVDVRSPGAIAAAVIPLLREPQRWEDTSERALQRAHDRYHLGRVVDSYQNAYASILRGGET